MSLEQVADNGENSYLNYCTAESTSNIKVVVFHFSIIFRRQLN